MVPAVTIAIISAYAVIEPFRVARNDDRQFVGTSFGSIVAAIVGDRALSSNGLTPALTGLSVLARSNLTYGASLGIEYAAAHKLPEGSPDFLGDIFLAPAHAFIPRALWANKPLGTIGLWYTRTVLGYDISSSTGMSPFTYLNFAGGPLAVILGFLIVGIIQRGLFDGLRQSGGGGLIVLFGLLSTLAVVDSAFNALFVDVLRSFPMLVVAQYILLKRPTAHRAVPVPRVAAGVP